MLVCPVLSLLPPPSPSLLLLLCLSTVCPAPFCVCVSGKKKRTKHPSLWTVSGPVFPLSNPPRARHSLEGEHSNQRASASASACPPSVCSGSPRGFCCFIPPVYHAKLAPGFLHPRLAPPKKKRKEEKSEDEERRRGRRRRTLRYPPALALMNSSLPARVEPLVLLLVFFFFFFFFLLFPSPPLFWLRPTFSPPPLSSPSMIYSLQSVRPLNRPHAVLPHRLTSQCSPLQM